MKNILSIAYALLVLIAFVIPMCFILAIAVVIETIRVLIKYHSIKYVAWIFGLRTNCPFCGGKLIQHGYQPNEYYTCSDNSCRFNKIASGDVAGSIRWNERSVNTCTHRD